MHYLFYDFETTSRDTQGQILTYAFILTDETLTPLEEIIGNIALSRTQLPEVEAILTNKIAILDHNQNADPEYSAAKKIKAMIESLIAKYGKITLSGFNTNSFDLDFLRTTLGRYGLNPYFGGKLANKDVLHFAQHLAFANPDDFPLSLKTTDTHHYYSFTLETLATTFGLLTDAQTHDALDDVRLTIALAKTLGDRYQLPFHAFQPFSLPEVRDSLHLFQYKTRHYAPLSETPQLCANVPVVLLQADKSTFLFLNLQRYQTLISETPSPTQAALLPCIVYANQNKSFCVGEPFSEEALRQWAPTIQHAQQNMDLHKLNPNTFFSMTGKQADIEHQIYKLPFSSLKKLGDLVETLSKDPSHYEDTLKSLLADRVLNSTISDDLIRLYNRAYLNLHPNPKQSYLKRYYDIRYEAEFLDQYQQTLEERLNRPDISAVDKTCLEQLKRYHQNHSLLTK